MQTPPNIDLTTALTAIAGVFAGPALANVVGPYAVIVIASLAGASWALSEETAITTRSGLWFLARITVTAAVLTGTFVLLLEHYVVPGTDASRWLIAPVAFTIGWIGKDWPKVFRFAGRVATRLADLWLRNRGGGDDKR